MRKKKVISGLQMNFLLSWKTSTANTSSILRRRNKNYKKKYPSSNRPMSNSANNRNSQKKPS